MVCGDGRARSVGRKIYRKRVKNFFKNILIKNIGVEENKISSVNYRLHIEILNPLSQIRASGVMLCIKIPYIRQGIQSILRLLFTWWFTLVRLIHSWSLSLLGVFFSCVKWPNYKLHLQVIPVLPKLHLSCSENIAECPLLAELLSFNQWQYFCQ